MLSPFVSAQVEGFVRKGCVKEKKEEKEPPHMYAIREYRGDYIVLVGDNMANPGRTNQQAKAPMFAGRTHWFRIFVHCTWIRCLKTV